MPDGTEAATAVEPGLLTATKRRDKREGQWGFVCVLFLNPTLFFFVPLSLVLPFPFLSIALSSGTFQTPMRLPKCTIVLFAKRRRKKPDSFK